MKLQRWEQAMKQMKNKLRILTILSFVTSILPVVLVVGINWNTYVETTGDAVKLTCGGIIAVFLVLLKVMDKLKVPNKFVLLGSVFVMSYLLQSILQDLTLLSGMALLGEVLDCFLFQTPIKRLREAIMIEKTADATSSKIESIIDKKLNSLNNGR